MLGSCKGFSQSGSRSILIDQYNDYNHLHLLRTYYMVVALPISNHQIRSMTRTAISIIFRDQGLEIWRTRLFFLDDLLWGACLTHQNACTYSSGHFPRHLELCPKRGQGFPWGESYEMEMRLWVAKFCCVETESRERQTEKADTQIEADTGKCTSWFLVGS